MMNTITTAPIAPDPKFKDEGSAIPSQDTADVQKKAESTPKDGDVSQKIAKKKKSKIGGMRRIAVAAIAIGIAYGSSWSYNNLDRLDIELAVEDVKSMFSSAGTDLLDPPSTLQTFKAEIAQEVKDSVAMEKITPVDALPNSIDMELVDEVQASRDSLFMDVVTVKSSAKQGDPHAQMLLADLYFNGVSLKKDNFLAYHWYKKAVEGFVSKDDENRVRLVEKRIDAVMKEVPDTVNPDYIIWNERPA